jgi:hypothetical protein
MTMPTSMAPGRKPPFGDHAPVVIDLDGGRSRWSIAELRWRRHA